MYRLAFCSQVGSSFLALLSVPCSNLVLNSRLNLFDFLLKKFTTQVAQVRIPRCARGEVQAWQTKHAVSINFRNSRCFETTVFAGLWWAITLVRFDSRLWEQQTWRLMFLCHTVAKLEHTIQRSPWIRIDHAFIPVSEYLVPNVCPDTGPQHPRT